MTGDLQFIGLTGHAKSGKNHIGTIIRDNFGLLPWAYALPIKQGVYARTEQWPIENVIGNAGKTPGLRNILQQEGTDVGRNQFRKDIWVRYADAFFYYVQTEWGNAVKGFVICDVRFPEEVKHVHSLGGKVLRVENRNLDLSHPMYQHASETGIADLPVSGIIDNTDFPGEEELLTQIRPHINL